MISVEVYPCPRCTGVYNSNVAVDDISFLLLSRQTKHVTINKSARCRRGEIAIKRSNLNDLESALTQHKFIFLCRRNRFLQFVTFAIAYYAA